MAQKFAGTERYVATDDLRIAVNAAITLQRPLLVKGEPGTGKTQLAYELAEALGAPLLDWLKLLLNEDVPPDALREKDPHKLIPPLHGALLDEQDIHLFERLAPLPPAPRSAELKPRGNRRSAVPAVPRIARSNPA